MMAEGGRRSQEGGSGSGGWRGWRATNGSPEAGRVPRGGPGRRRGGAAGPGGGGTAPLAVLCGMHCQGEGGCAALQARSNSTGER